MTKNAAKNLLTSIALMSAVVMPCEVFANRYHTLGMLVEDCNSKDPAVRAGCSYYLQGISDAVMESWAIRKLSCEDALLTPVPPETTIFGQQGLMLARVMHAIMGARKEAPQIDQQPAAKVVRMVLEGYCPTPIPAPK